MNNSGEWKPGRFAFKDGKLEISTDRAELAVQSRLITWLVAEAFNEHFLKHCRGRLLDLGCGKVPFYEFYRNHVEETVCADWGNTLHGSRHVDVTCDLTKPLPFQDDEFDTVLLSDVLEHIATPQQLMNEVSRVLRRNGRLILNVPFMYWLHETPHDYYRYTEFALRRMTELSGLDVLLLEPLGGPSAVLADISAKRLIQIPGIGSLLARMVQSLCRVWLQLAKRNVVGNDGKQLFPSEYFMIARKPG